MALKGIRKRHCRIAAIILSAALMMSNATASCPVMAEPAATVGEKTAPAQNGDGKGGKSKETVPEETGQEQEPEEGEGASQPTDDETPHEEKTDDPGDDSSASETGTDDSGFPNDDSSEPSVPDDSSAGDPGDDLIGTETGKDESQGKSDQSTDESQAEEPPVTPAPTQILTPSPTEAPTPTPTLARIPVTLTPVPRRDTGGNEDSGRTTIGTGTTPSLYQGMKRVEKKVQEYRLTKEVVMTTTEDVVANLNVRTGRGTDYPLAGSIKKGGVFFLLKEADKDGWCYVEAEDALHKVLRGYVKSSFITGTNAAARMKKYGEKYRSYIKVKRTEDENPVFGDVKTTVYQHLVDEHTTVTYEWVKDTGTGINKSVKASANRMLMVQYSMQFLGNPYVWGGESLTEGCDCSGFTMLIYRQFGIELPRCSYEQAEVGTKIDPKDALPGDLLFYARDGVVYHVLMYIGNGQAINASSSTTGIIISNVDYGKTCWGVRMIDDSKYTSTQASSLLLTAKKAYQGDREAQDDIIEALGKAVQKELAEYGFLPSVIMAQAIQESGWLSFSGASDGGIQPEDNNILGMNEDLLNDQWESPWKGGSVMRNVPQWDGEKDVYGEESMRTYEDIESCFCDYAAFKIGLHPDLANEKDVEKVVEEGLEGYATDPGYKNSILKIIDKYGLDKYDVMGEYAKDPTNYTQEDLELIWAIVAQEDDTGYEGALAVISSAMNRADANYGGYGTTALEQLTADGQYCYSPKVSDPSLYQRRLAGNVEEYVKQAVSDCLTGGVRNNEFLNFRSSNRTGKYTRIGDNWYF